MSTALMIQSILTAGLSWLALTAFFYRLLAPVNKNISLAGLFLSFASCACAAFGYCLHFARLGVLRLAQLLSVYELDSLPALANLLLRLRAQFFNYSLIFIVSYCVVVGYLFYMSTAHGKQVRV